MSHLPLQPHRRQLVIGPEAARIREDWRCQRIDQSTWISHCPDLRITWATDADAARWLLAGRAVETIEARGAPVVEIAARRTDAVPDLRLSWAGRWLLVGGGRAYLDGSGLLGCYYGRTAAGQVWASSSPALIARMLFAEGSPPADPRILRYNTGISWYAPPRSRFAGVSRLLPSQTLDLRTARVLPQPLMPPIEPALGYERTLSLFIQAMLTALRRLAAEGQPLHLGLTGGYDSRLMLGLAREAGIEVRPFTRIAGRMSVADRVLPGRLAPLCGYRHLYLRPRRDRADRTRLVADHTAGHVSEGDAEPFLHGVRDKLNGLSFGGHGFAIASGFGRMRQLPPEPADPLVGARQIAAVLAEPPGTSATDGLCEWLEWAMAHPQKHLDWRDRFFLEQRQAGWLSSKEQLYDLSEVERFPMLNAARTYALLLGIDEERRLDSQVQVEIIRRVAPQLMKYPFNPDDDAFGRLRAALVRASNDPGAVYRRIKRWVGSPRLRRKRPRQGGAP